MGVRGRIVGELGPEYSEVGGSATAPFERSLNAPSAVSDTPGLDEVLGLHTEPLGHTCDVVEIADHLSGVVHCPVVEPVLPKGLHVSLAHRPAEVGQLLRVAAESLVPRGQVRRPAVPRDGVDEGVGLVAVGEITLDLGPEVMRVRLRSVEAVVGLRGHHGQHLPLAPAEG